MRKFTILFLAALMLLAGCKEAQRPIAAVAPTAADTDDTTIYGLACDGCNDTIVVFLREPYDGSDPDTLNILEASRRHMVFGTLRIGDEVALVRDTTDSTCASIVIVTQDLLGQWCYKAKPTLRRKAGQGAAEAGGDYSHLPDSVRRLLDEEREYGIALKIDSVAMTIGLRRSATTADEESPVEYPQPRRYRRWYISNGQLMLALATTDSLAQGQPAEVDTADFVMLTADTLVLRFADGEHGYYRRTE